ncbi:MAG: hypothetical protein AAF405_06270 [Pseudomonadota bacterium]
MRFLVLIVCAVGLISSAHAVTYSEAVRKYCRADYKKYCGEYGLETKALRNCMRRHGDQLSKSCIEALVQSGEVSRRELERWRRARQR